MLGSLGEFSLENGNLRPFSPLLGTNATEESCRATLFEMPALWSEMVACEEQRDAQKGRGSAVARSYRTERRLRAFWASRALNFCTADSMGAHPMVP